jgi:hypothetical protein
MGLEPITSRVRTERTAARAPGPHGQHGGHDRIRTGDLERDKLAGTAGLPYVSTTQISGGLGCWPRRARLMRPCCALARPRHIVTLRTSREGKNSGWCCLGTYEMREPHPSSVSSNDWVYRPNFRSCAAA